MIELLRNYCATIASLPVTPFTLTPIPLLRVSLKCQHPEKQSLLFYRSDLALQERILTLRTPRPAAGVSRALRARSVPGVLPRVSPKTGGCLRECPTGCRRGPSGPGPRSVQKVSRECPRSVRDTFLTLRGHSQDTFWTLPRTPPVFGDTPGDTSGPKGPRDPVAGRGSFPKLVERSILKLPLSKLCAVPLPLQSRAIFEGRKREKKVPRKGEEEG